MMDLDAATLATIGAGYCPDCGGPGFRLGPRGGAAQNIECMACRQRFTIVVYGWQVMLGERLAAADGVRAARRGYRDDAVAPRACDRCGGLYRGPAVYCSLECAVSDAAAVDP